MGREIERERFGGADFERFSERLGESLVALAELLERPGFGEGPATVGAELEMALVDAAGRPAGENVAVQEALGGDDDVALEVGRFCIECATAAGRRSPGAPSPRSPPGSPSWWSASPARPRRTAPASP